MTVAAVVCAVLALVSCQKDPEDLIVGTWLENKVTYSYTQGGVTESSSMLEPNEIAEITFNKDNTYTSVYHSEEGDGEDSGTWSIDGNTLTITDEFGPMGYNIDQLDKKVCNLSYTQSGADEDGPFTVTIVIKMTRK